jgi:hypothetical protein
MARPAGFPRRRSAYRKPKARVLVCCQGGETEPNYFRALKRDVADHFVVKVATTNGKSPPDTVQRAMREQATATQRGKEFRFDEVWCVLDVEQAGTNPQLADARTLAKQRGFREALSNPAFEVWLLAHFERTTRSFLDGAQLIGQLDKHWQDAFHLKYEKNDEGIYRRIRDRTGQAINNARQVREVDFMGVADIADCNSATDVYLLVERLMELPGAA